MAYVSAQLNLLAQGVGGAPNLWSYYGTDVHTDIDAADFISDGDAKGLEVGDFVLAYKTSATKGATLHSVETVTAGGAATLSPAILA
jgi:hypothetical protein